MNVLSLIFVSHAAIECNMSGVTEIHFITGKEQSSQRTHKQPWNKTCLEHSRPMWSDGTAVWDDAGETSRSQITRRMCNDPELCKYVTRSGNWYVSNSEVKLQNYLLGGEVQIWRALKPDEEVWILSWQ